MQSRRTKITLKSAKRNHAQAVANPLQREYRKRKRPRKRRQQREKLSTKKLALKEEEKRVVRLRWGSLREDCHRKVERAVHQRSLMRFALISQLARNRRRVQEVHHRRARHRRDRPITWNLKLSKMQ